jgi:hypothetical protein
MIRYERGEHPARTHAADRLASASGFFCRFVLAEGARFELAVHEVDAGFQDRWFQPLTHPSEAMRFGRQ